MPYSAAGSGPTARAATLQSTDPFNGSTDHPNVGVGVLTMLVGPIQALMIVMVATYITSRTERPTP